jgi:transcriptional regulator with PAS, ATPase and Fis domain
MSNMPSDPIPDSRILKQEILASHTRAQQYGVNPSVFCNPDHVHLSADELAQQREQNKEFLEVAKTQIHELYRFVAGAGFVATIVEKDGYILEAIGDGPLLEHLQSANCRSGYRWTEKDVGTGSISLALARKIPVQINDDEHYCQRGYGHTCSAAPVFDENDDLVGVISMSGEASQVHPHTLCMLITAARAIENQLRITKTSKALLLQNNYMNALIESIDSGVIAVDTNGMITHFNSQAKLILNWHEKLEGKTLSDIFGSQVNLNQMMHSGFEFVDREIFLKSKSGVIQLLITSKPIFDAEQKVIGIIFVFSAIHRIRKLINEMAGSQASFNFEDIIGCSPDIMEAKRLAMLAASGNSTVLILGETGTGKELFAQSIHNLSARKHHPFVAINCGAIPRELLESELFGYTEGSFTGAKRGGRPGKLELANSGTLFLDEIGDMPVDMQVKFLRVLQTGEMCRIGQHKPISIDLRVIAATHFDLEREVNDGNFREDLYYRLNVLPIHIPPLCERSADILLLAKHILSRCRQVFKKPDIKFSPEAERMLIGYNWPGNVRELENVVERAVNLVDEEFIQPEHFGLQTPENKNIAKKVPRGALLEKAEEQTITEVVETTGYNISEAAHILGISRATLYNKLKKYNYSILRSNV